jgi:DNA polymerase
LPPLIEDEQRLWQLDAMINARGFHIDSKLVDAAHEVVTRDGAILEAEFHAIADLDSTQTKKIPLWLAAHGCVVPNIQKATLRAALRRKGLEPSVRRAIELRLQLAHASAAKVEALRNWRGPDNRVRGAFGFHGASTGRWAGRGPQPQNFKRDSEGVDAKIAAILNDGAGLESPVEAVGDIARAMICAPPGHRYFIGDFSGIESRVLAWLSRQGSKLELWAKFDRTKDPNDDPYVVIGRALGHPEKWRAPTARLPIWPSAFKAASALIETLRRKTTMPTKRRSSNIAMAGAGSIRRPCSFGTHSTAPPLAPSDALASIIKSVA